MRITCFLNAALVGAAPSAVVTPLKPFAFSATLALIDELRLIKPRMILLDLLDQARHGATRVAQDAPAPALAAGAVAGTIGADEQLFDTRVDHQSVAHRDIDISML